MGALVYTMSYSGGKLHGFVIWGWGEESQNINRLIRFTTIYMILVIRSDLFYSIGASHATKIITPSDPTRETDHLDHDPYYQVIVNRITPLSFCIVFDTEVNVTLYKVYNKCVKKCWGRFHKGT